MHVILFAVNNLISKVVVTGMKKMALKYKFGKRRLKFSMGLLILALINEI